MVAGVRTLAFGHRTLDSNPERCTAPPTEPGKKHQDFSGEDFEIREFDNRRAAGVELSSRRGYMVGLTSAGKVEGIITQARDVGGWGCL